MDWKFRQNLAATVCCCGSALIHNHFFQLHLFPIFSSPVSLLPWHHVMNAEGPPPISGSWTAEIRRRILGVFLVTIRWEVQLRRAFCCRLSLEAKKSSAWFPGVCTPEDRTSSFCIWALCVVNLASEQRTQVSAC